MLPPARIGSIFHITLEARRKCAHHKILLKGDVRWRIFRLFLSARMGHDGAQQHPEYRLCTQASSFALKEVDKPLQHERLISDSVLFGPAFINSFQHLIAEF
jgi:hypothetical protein